MEEKLLTVEEVAKYLNVSEEEVKALVDKGHLPAYKIGGIILRFKREHVEGWRKKINSTGIGKNTFLRRDDSKAAYAKNQGLWIDRKAASRVNYNLKYAFWERAADFFYYNDFYILSLILLGIIVIISFR